MRFRGALSPMQRQTPTRSELDALLAGPGPQRTPLDGLMEAARGAAQPHELLGLDAAVAVFQSGPESAAATGAPRHRAAAPARVGGLVARVLALKVFLICLGTMALGGFAYAAVDGDLPGITHHHAPGRHASTTASHGQGVATPAPGTGSRPAGVPPAAALPGLCVSWLASASDPNRSTDQRFAALEQAAGSAGAVTAYCTNLVASTSPGNSTHPTGPPSSVSIPTHPSGPPSSIPSPSHPLAPTSSAATTTHPGRSSHPTGPSTHPGH